MSRANEAQTRTPRHPKLKIAVGDVVSWGSQRTIGVVQAIRIIESGRHVQSYAGNGADVVLTISDGVGTASVLADDGTVSHVEQERARPFLSRMAQKHRS